jgi:hypothetical protein
MIGKVWSFTGMLFPSQRMFLVGDKGRNGSLLFPQDPDNGSPAAVKKGCMDKDGSRQSPSFLAWKQVSIHPA